MFQPLQVSECGGADATLRYGKQETCLAFLGVVCGAQPPYDVVCGLGLRVDCPVG